MELTSRKLLTIVTESALEEMLVREIEILGARGYTITDARGKGGRGKRDATWAPHANIRLEVLCDADTAHAICSALRERYYDNYSMVMYVGEVDVLRPEKF
ncbi:MAG: transcriptional regulator [Polaromonas sp.]|uniref:P-II family nitrogen regulator n=1 Tax=Polaromonas sp. TaxID=1869339 RepID=UPI0040366F68|nr:transcriptional regulator [Polaromonas sp.]